MVRRIAVVAGQCRNATGTCGTTGNPSGGPPNNWLSMFGGQCLDLDEQTGQFYYHAFLKEQPDLNWRNPDVRNAMYDVLRFWLDRGVDGFRVDVLSLLIKDERVARQPAQPGLGSRAATVPSSRYCRSTRPTDRRSRTSSPSMRAVL